MSSVSSEQILTSQFDQKLQIMQIFLKIMHIYYKLQIIGISS